MSEGKVLGDFAPVVAPVAVLPLTSGGSVFQTIVLATLVVAIAVVVVRIIKHAALARSAR